MQDAIMNEVAANAPISPVKPWWKSKTVILAMLQALVGIVVIMETQFPGLGLIAVVKSIFDIVIRFTTELPIA